MKAVMEVVKPDGEPGGGEAVASGPRPRMSELQKDMPKLLGLLKPEDVLVIRATNGAQRYPVGVEDQEVIDGILDELTEQGKLRRIRRPTPFGNPVFVV